MSVVIAVKDKDRKRRYRRHRSRSCALPVPRRRRWPLHPRRPARWRRRCWGCMYWRRRRWRRPPAQSRCWRRWPHPDRQSRWWWPWSPYRPTDHGRRGGSPVPVPGFWRSGAHKSGTAVYFAHPAPRPWRWWSRCRYRRAGS